jgi:hypothetical protein
MPVESITGKNASSSYFVSQGVDNIHPSCSPNASYTFDFESWTLSVTAARHISAGEEITFAYTDVLECRASRRKVLLETRHFECVCDACDNPRPEEVAASDRRREELKNWARTAPVMWMWLSDFSLPDDYVLQPHLRALELMQEEGLHLPQRAEHLSAIVNAYSAMGDRVKFIEWMEKLEEYRRSTGNIREAEKIRRLIVTPELDSEWEIRAKAQAGMKFFSYMLPSTETLAPNSVCFKAKRKCSRKQFLTQRINHRGTKGFGH